MSSLSTGASRKVPASLRLSNSTTADLGRPDLGRPDLGRPDLGRPDLGRPDLRWRAVRNPVGRRLMRLFLAAARPLLVWQRRMRDRDYLQRLPDYLLRDIGLDTEAAQAEKIGSASCRESVCQYV